MSNIGPTKILSLNFTQTLGFHVKHSDNISDNDNTMLANDDDTRNL